jgi:predicted site-specific integrase-resolvase
MSGTHITLVAAHRDRLAKFGVELIRQILEKNGGKLVVLDETLLSPEQELSNDLLNHVFSARMHGLRSYKKQINQIITDNGTETPVSSLA